MASVSGPLFSMDASGSIGKTIVFSKWRGRNYVRGHAIPSNPRSQGQRYTRAWLSFLSTVWASLTALDQATWANLAEGDNLPDFDGYIRGNMNRVKNLLSPSMAYPAAEAQSITATGTNSVTGQVGQFVGTINLSDPTNVWGVAILVAPGSTAPDSFSYAQKIVKINDTNDHEYVVPNLDAGTYSVSYVAFSEDGIKSAITDDDEVTVT